MNAKSTATAILAAAVSIPVMIGAVSAPMAHGTPVPGRVSIAAPPSATIELPAPSTALRETADSYAVLAAQGAPHDPYPFLTPEEDKAAQLFASAVPLTALGATLGIAGGIGLGGAAGVLAGAALGCLVGLPFIIVGCAVGVPIGAALGGTVGGVVGAVAGTAIGAAAGTALTLALVNPNGDGLGFLRPQQAMPPEQIHDAAAVVDDNPQFGAAVDQLRTDVAALPGAVEVIDTVETAVNNIAPQLIPSVQGVVDQLSGLLPR
ncbi:hypothetical protein [Nocardia sp. NPDC052566]|uniref:hypothetical protein n=1 Tax=Nocardia sp. NPDC052566 TaxID=3364330 RepID=UPI0037C6D24E